MRTGFSLLLLLLSGCSAPQAVEPVPPTAQAVAPLTALSFNIRYGTADDGPDAWVVRRESVAALLVASQAELIGIQEGLDFQLEYLDRVLPHHRRVGQGREGGSRGEHVALYYDTRRFRLLRSEDRWLSETPDQVASVGWDAGLTRLCTFAHLRDQQSGRSLIAWNTHFDHRGERAREESARLLVRWMQTENQPSLVLGDLNAGEDSSPLRELRAAGLRDSYRDVHAQGPATGTFHAFRGGRSGDKIDYCLVDSGFRTLAAEILDQRGAHGRWPSDHHAVWAVIDWVN